MSVLTHEDIFRKFYDKMFYIYLTLEENPSRQKESCSNQILCQSTNVNRTLKLSKTNCTYFY